MRGLVLALLGLSGMTAATARTPDAAYRAEIEKWRADREARLKGDGGWLQVVGLFWLKEGANSFGSDTGNAIVLPAGSAPARAGVFELRGGKTTVRMEPGVEATVEGKPAGARELRPDVPGPADMLKLGPRLDPVAPEDGQKPDAPSALPGDALPVFSWRHPVTGQPIRYPSGTQTAGEFPTFGKPATLLSSAGSLPQRVAEAERKQRQLAADIGAENVSNAFGNYIDDFEWELLGALFRNGAVVDLRFELL